MLRDMPTIEERARSAYIQVGKLLDFFMAHTVKGYNYEAMTVLEQTASHLETHARAFAQFPRLRPPLTPPRAIYTKPVKAIQYRGDRSQGSLKIETPTPEQLQKLYDRS
jgi:hypothetical protein